MAFVQFAKDFVIERLDGTGDKQAARARQFCESIGVAEEVGDLYGDVVGELRKLRVQLIHDARGVRHAIEKVRIAESDVPSADRDLLANIAEDYFARNNTKLAGIHRDDRAVAAKMFAPARRFGVADGVVRSIRENNVRVLAEFRQAGAIRQFERQTRQWRM